MHVYLKIFKLHHCQASGCGTLTLHEKIQMSQRTQSNPTQKGVRPLLLSISINTIITRGPHKLQKCNTLIQKQLIIHPRDDELPLTSHPTVIGNPYFQDRAPSIESPESSRTIQSVAYPDLHSYKRFSTVYFRIWASSSQPGIPIWELRVFFPKRNSQSEERLMDEPTCQTFCNSPVAGWCDLGI